MPTKQSQFVTTIDAMPNNASKPYFMNLIRHSKNSIGQLCAYMYQIQTIKFFRLKYRYKIGT
jgi:hypothetical protein